MTRTADVKRQLGTLVFLPVERPGIVIKIRARDVNPRTNLVSRLISLPRSRTLKFIRIYGRKLIGRPIKPDLLKSEIRFVCRPPPPPIHS